MTNLERELDHLARNSRWHPSCAEYCMVKANWLAQKRPEEFGKLPALLATKLKSSASAASGTPAGKSPKDGS